MLFNYMILSKTTHGAYTLSDGWTTDDLVFLWKEGDPVQVVKNLHLPRFTLEKFLTDYCNSKTNTGTSVQFVCCWSRVPSAVTYLILLMISAIMLTIFLELGFLLVYSLVAYFVLRISYFSYFVCICIKRSPAIACQVF